MPEDPKETILVTLSLIKENIIQHIDRLIQLLEFFLVEDNKKRAPGCVSYIQNIQQGSLLLKQETIRLLEKKLTQEQLKSVDLSNYLSKIRHDLRNPINSMQGYAEISLEEFQLAEERSLSSKMEEVITLIRELLVFIDNINISQHRSTSAQSTLLKKIDALSVSNLDEFSSTERESTTEEEFLRFKEEISILVVDDVEENCQVLKLYLNNIGYKNIQIAHHGRQALQLIEDNPIEIVLLDIDMPEMSGIEVLLNIKKHARHRHIMVMMVSAADTMENTINCIKLGAEDFLPKPFNRDLLRVRMSSCAEKKWFQNKEMQYNQQIEVEKQRYEKLLNIILPPSIVTELTTANQVKTRYYQNVAVLFTDVVSFTTYCDTHSLSEVEENLQKFSELCEEIAIKYNLQKIKTIGDAFLATAGMLIENKNPVLDCLNCAVELLASSVQLLPAKWQLRAGIAFGSVIGGVIGHRQFLFDIWGDTVNTSSRIQAAADPDSILLTKDAVKQVQDICHFESLGLILLKGKTPMELFKYLGKK